MFTKNSFLCAIVLLCVIESVRPTLPTKLFQHHHRHGNNWEPDFNHYGTNGIENEYPSNWGYPGQGSNSGFDSNGLAGNRPQYFNGHSYGPTETVSGQFGGQAPNPNYGQSGNQYGPADNQNFNGFYGPKPLYPGSAGSNRQPGHNAGNFVNNPSNGQWPSHGAPEQPSNFGTLGQNGYYGINGVIAQPIGYVPGNRGFAEQGTVNGNYIPSGSAGLTTKSYTEATTSTANYIEGTNGQPTTENINNNQLYTSNLEGTTSKPRGTTASPDGGVGGVDPIDTLEKQVNDVFGKTNNKLDIVENTIDDNGNSGVSAGGISTTSEGLPTDSIDVRAGEDLEKGKSIIGASERIVPVPPEGGRNVVKVICPEGQVPTSAGCLEEI